MRNNHLTIAKMVSAEQEFAGAAAQPKETWGPPAVTIAAPPEVETILLEERLAHAAGKPRVLSDEEYAKVLERVATMKSAATTNRRANRMSITAKKGEPAKERAEFQYGEPRQGASRIPPK
jgi:hypothetical protein